MTYLQILNLIKDTALAQPNVNSVVREFLDLNREDAKYSAIVIQDRDGSRDRNEEQDYVTYTWHLGYVDRLTYDESNRDDIISTGINIIDNIMNTIRNTWFPELEVSIIDRINTLNQRFTAQCAGVYVVLAVNVQVSDCVDSESNDLYDTYDAKITANGVYHFVPSGRPVDEINITVDVNGWGQKSITEGTNIITNLDNSASFVTSNAFMGNTNIQTVNLPYATSVGNNAFHSCSSLSQVNLPVCSYIGSDAFYNCSSLSIITIGYSGVCSLGGSTTFSNTQITSSTGSIYVPASLVDVYKTAANWSYFKDRIFTIPS